MVDLLAQVGSTRFRRTGQSLNDEAFNFAGEAFNSTSAGMLASATRAFAVKHQQGIELDCVGGFADSGKMPP